MKSFGQIASSTFVCPLDFVTGAACAYALWRLRNAYTGYAIEVRRSSDNATTDVSFDISGVVSNSSLVSAGGTFGTWRGASTIFIRTYYDQSGNACNLLQATNGSQPIYTDSHYLSKPVARIVAASSIFMQNTNTVLKSPVNSCSVFSRMNVDNGAGTNSFLEGGNGTLTGLFCTTSNRFRMVYRSPYNNSGGDDILSATGNVPSATYFSYMGVRNSVAGTQTVYKDNVSVGNLTGLTQPAMPVSNMLITYGGLLGVSNMTGYLAAVIIFPFALTAQQRTYLQANV